MALNLTSGSHIKQLCRIANDYNVKVSLEAHPGDPNTYLFINGKYKPTINNSNSINLDDPDNRDAWAFGDTEVDKILQKIAQLDDSQRNKLLQHHYILRQ